MFHYLNMRYLFALSFFFVLFAMFDVPQVQAAGWEKQQIIWREVYQNRIVDDLDLLVNENEQLTVQGTGVGGSLFQKDILPPITLVEDEGWEEVPALGTTNAEKLRAIGTKKAVIIRGGFGRVLFNRGIQDVVVRNLGGRRVAIAILDDDNRLWTTKLSLKGLFKAEVAYAASPVIPSCTGYLPTNQWNDNFSNRLHLKFANPGDKFFWDFIINAANNPFSFYGLFSDTTGALGVAGCQPSVSELGGTGTFANLFADSFLSTQTSVGGDVYRYIYFTTGFIAGIDINDDACLRFSYDNLQRIIALTAFDNGDCGDILVTSYILNFSYDNNLDQPDRIIFDDLVAPASMALTYVPNGSLLGSIIADVVLATGPTSYQSMAVYFPGVELLRVDINEAGSPIDGVTYAYVNGYEFQGAQTETMSVTFSGNQTTRTLFGSDVIGVESVFRYP